MDALLQVPPDRERTLQTFRGFYLVIPGGADTPPKSAERKPPLLLFSCSGHHHFSPPERSATKLPCGWLAEDPCQQAGKEQQAHLFHNPTVSPLYSRQPPDSAEAGPPPCLSSKTFFQRRAMDSCFTVFVTLTSMPMP